MIGTTRSRVSFFMNKFRKLGLIDYNGSIEIHSSLLNVVLRDQPQIRKLQTFAPDNCAEVCPLLLGTSSIALKQYSTNPVVRFQRWPCALR